MSIVFINYRRDETAGEARALHNGLAELLGHERVFMDVDDIALGRDFREVLKERLDTCDVMLSLIGRDWAHARDAAGQRRLDNPSDFVRLEIATALQRHDVAVTPVLLQDARMPSADALPDDLKGLAYRNGFELSHARWESDLHELVRRLGLAPSAAATTAPDSPAAAARPTAAAGTAPGATPPSVPMTPQPATSANTPTGTWLAPGRSPATVALAAAALVAIAGLGAWFAMRDKPAAASATVVTAPVAAAAAAAAPVPMPVPAIAASAAAGPDQAEIAALVTQLAGDADPARRAAADRLRRDFGQSPVAVGLAVNQLLAPNFRVLSKEGRLEVLGFLLAADAAAWTPDRRLEAAEVLRRIRQRVDAGEVRLTQPVQERIDALARRVGA